MSLFAANIFFISFFRRFLSAVVTVRAYCTFIMPRLSARLIASIT